MRTAHEKGTIKLTPEGAVGTYIRVFLSGKQKPKTSVWFVETAAGDAPLGVIQWFAHWRKYAFFPEDHTAWEETCLYEIAFFLAHVTRSHQAKKRCTPERKFAPGESFCFCGMVHRAQSLAGRG